MRKKQLLSDRASKPRLIADPSISARDLMGVLRNFMNQKESNDIHALIRQPGARPLSSVLGTTKGLVAGVSAAPKFLLYLRECQGSQMHGVLSFNFDFFKLLNHFLVFNHCLALDQQKGLAQRALLTLAADFAAVVEY